MAGALRAPTKRERELKEALDAAEERCRLLLSGCSGAAVIAGLEERLAACEPEIVALEGLKARNAALAEQNKKLKEQNRQLKREASALGWDVRVAHEYGRELEREVKRLEGRRDEWIRAARRHKDALDAARAEIRALKARLSRNSANSSLPPSVSPKSKVCNSRELPGRRPGGQPGHPGHRRRREPPDETVAIPAPESCPGCGGALEGSSPPKARRTTDIVVTARTVEYTAYDCVCADCGTVVPAAFPVGVANEDNYGDGLRAAATYLANWCNVSIDNVTAFIYEATGHRIKLSKGSVHNFLNSFSQRAAGEVALVRAAVAASPAVGSDATHTSASGRRSYVYSFNTESAALFCASAAKGAAPLKGSPLESYHGIIAHDHDLAYYNHGGAHAECNAHVLRYLRGVCENEPERCWAPLMRALLAEANEAAKAARASGAALDAEAAAAFAARYDEILALAAAEYAAGPPVPAKYKPEGVALSNRLREYRDSHLLFLRDPAAPFDNNASERQLRRVKGKTKQSGGFRSLDNGQALYCDFLTVAKTAAMNGLEVLDVVRRVFEGEAGILKEALANSPPPDHWPKE